MTSDQSGAPKALPPREPFMPQMPAAARSAYGGTHLTRTIAIVLAPLMVGVLAALFLAVPDQTREIYRIFARDYALQPPLPDGATWPVLADYIWTRLSLSPIDLSWIGIALAGVLNWRLARSLTLQFGDGAIKERSVRGVTLRWLPRFCGAIIPFGAATGLLLAAGDVRRLPFDLAAQASGATEEEAAANLIVVAGLFFVTGLALLVWAWWRTHNKHYKYTNAGASLFSAMTVTLMIGATLALIVLFATAITGSAGVHAAWALRTPALFCLFIMLLAYFATGLSVLTLRSGIPIVPLMALGVLLIAVFDFNDNHGVPTAASPAAIAKPSTREAFQQWYEARADRAVYERAGKPYPVFLVTAAGGGIYATDFAATALARMQDRCAAFAQHVFAVSGVSGGGLGAAIFANLVKDTRQVTAEEIGNGDPCAARPPVVGRASLEARSGSVVSQDYLSPIVAAGLFPDFFQRFLPVAVPLLDRARAFEATLDIGWARSDTGCTGEGCKPFARPFLGTWRADGTAPALVLNATNVDTGYRTVLAPFAIARDVPGEYSALEDFHETLAGAGAARAGVDVSLGVAVSLSSRFPWVMPAASVRSADGARTVRLLDGGIFENSGVDTLTDMLIDLRGLETPPAERPDELKGAPWVVFHPIIISGFQLSSPETANGLRGEALSPVSAMLATRVQRAGMASYRLFLERGYNCGKDEQSAKCRENGLRFLVLNHVDYRLPLGWQVSDFTRRVVASHVGNAGRCDPIPRIRSMFTGGPNPELRSQRQHYTQRENDCTACSVIQALRAQPLKGSDLCRGS